MATICGASIALKAAGIDISNLVAGVAMGLIVEDDKYAILTDIIGLEDHDGDMDFKVAGTKNGITALQMDIKLGGISLNILEEALIQASKAKNEILDIMEESSKNITPSNALPLIEQFKVDSNKIMLKFPSILVPFTSWSLLIKKVSAGEAVLIFFSRSRF